MSGWIYVQTSKTNSFTVGTSNIKCLDEIKLLIGKMHCYTLSSSSSLLQMMMINGMSEGAFSATLWSWYKVWNLLTSFCTAAGVNRVFCIFTSFLHLCTTGRQMKAMELFSFFKQLLYHVTLIDGKGQMGTMWVCMFAWSGICVNLLVLYKGWNCFQWWSQPLNGNHISFVEDITLMKRRK